jgi:hypothetical protein
MDSEKIPGPVIAVVADVLGNHYYSHTKLNTLFEECGAPGDPPEGNCVEKCRAWLKRANSDPSVDAFVVLGCVLEWFMDFDLSGFDPDEEWPKQRERVKRVLANHGLSYNSTGKIIGASTGVPSRSLADIIRDRDLGSIEIEFQRAINTVNTDPPASVTAACAIIESLCKVYIEDENLEMPRKATIKNLWSVIQKDIGLTPKIVEDEDLARMLGGLASIIDGIGAIRTHAGSAHGRGRGSYHLAPRHARLAIHSAHTLVTFIIETWEARKSKCESFDD